MSNGATITSVKNTKEAVEAQILGLLKTLEGYGVAIKRIDLSHRSDLRTASEKVQNITIIIQI